MARDVLARCECPECGSTGAEVKRTKARLLYRWCPECLAQYFPKSQAASDRLAVRVGISTGTGTEPAAPALEPAPVQERKPEPVQPAPDAKPAAKKTALWFEGLGA